MNPTAYIRTAKKKYRCEARSSPPCNNPIHPGNNYFAITLQLREDRHITRKICLECARRLYPDLIPESLAKMKNRQKLKRAKRSIRDVRYLSGKANALRKKPTKSEEILWENLKNGALGAAFFRQKLLHGYIVDFWCPEMNLVIELDGWTHGSRKQKMNFEIRLCENMASPSFDFDRRSSTMT